MPSLAISVSAVLVLSCRIYYDLNGVDRQTERITEADDRCSSDYRVPSA